MKKYVGLSILFFSFGFMPDIAMAHGGGLNKNGCHKNRKTGGYHCHRSSYTPPQNYVVPRTLFNNQSQSRARANLNPPPRTINLSTKVKTAQTLLYALDYYNGPIDGLAGVATQQSIVKFTRDKGLLSTVIDDNLIFHLSTAINNRPQG